VLTCAGFTSVGLRTLSRCCIVFALVALIQGCTTLSQNLLQNVPPDYQVSPGDPDGLIVVSTRFLPVGCPGESSISSAFFATFNEGTYVPHQTIFMKSPSVMVDPADPARQLFVRKLKPGRYSFSKFSYAFSALEKASENGKVSVPFNVTAGEIHYLGELVVTAEDCRTLAVKVSNQRKRDMDLLSTRLTKIPPASVKNQIVAVNEMRTP